MTTFIIIILIGITGVLIWLLSAGYRNLQKGIKLFNNEKYEDALTVFTALREKKYTKAISWVSKAYFAIGELHFKSKQYNEAILSFEKSSEPKAKASSDKAKAHILYDQALPFYKQKEYKTVISIIDNFPSEPAQSLYQKSLALVNIQSYEELYQLNTIDGFKKCQELALQIVGAIPDKQLLLDNAIGEIAYLNGIEFYQKMSFLKALDCFKRAIDKKDLFEWLKKATDEVFYEHGSKYFEATEFQKAKKSFLKIPDDSHKFEDARRAIVKCQLELDFLEGVNHFENKEFAKAAKLFKAILEAHPKAAKWLERANAEIELLNGIKLFKKGDFQKAQNTFAQCKHKEAKSWLVKTNDEIKYGNALAYFNENNFDEALETIETIVNELPKALSLKSDCQNEIKYLEAERLYEKKSFGKCLPIYTSLKDDLLKAKKKLTKLKLEIYVCAKTFEKEVNYNGANELYDLILGYYPKHKVVADIYCRKLIIKTKLDQSVTIEDIKTVSSKEVTESNITDLNYRWLVQNYQKGEFDIVAKYLPKFFPNYKHEQSLDKLVNDIIQFYYKLLSDKIDALNNILKNEFSYAKMKKVYAHFEEYYLQVINEVDTILQMPILENIEIKFLNKNVGNLKSKLFKDLVNTGIHEGDYVFVFNLIKKEEPSFFKKHSLLNNVAICCFQIVANNLLNSKNYREVISIWLSSVYLDDLIISSLQNTSWDDEHHFTLNGTIGWLNDKSLLDDVENVSNSSSINAISISESQTALVTSFAKEISAYNDDKIQEFYKEEANAITELIKHKNVFNKKNIYIAAPYFTHAYNLNVPIVDNLIALYIKENDKINLLKVATKYTNSAYKPVLIKDFLKISKGEEYLLETYRKLKSIDLAELGTAKLPYEKFPVMASNLEKQIINIFTSHKEKHQYTNRLWKNTYQLFSVLPKSKKLAYSFVDYTNRLVVNLHENNEISSTKALGYLNEALRWDEDEQAKKNAIQFIAIFLLDSVVENGEKINKNESQEIFKYLDKFPAHSEVAEFLLQGMVLKNKYIEKLFNEIEVKYPGKRCYKELKANTKMQRAIMNINESKWQIEKAFDTFLDGMEIAITDTAHNNFEALFNGVFQEAFKGNISQVQFNAYLKRLKRLNSTTVINALKRIHRGVLQEIGSTNYQFHSLIRDVENGDTYGYQPEGIRMARILIALKNAA